jgi:hypothetical protein
MYEHRSQPLLPPRQFARRALLHTSLAFVLLSLSLGLGVLGYHFLVGLGWLDSLLNAAMLLGGMGPVDPIPGVPGKLFASFYALFAGVVFLAISGILVAPFAHRLLHRLHLDTDETG